MLLPNIVADSASDYSKYLYWHLLVKLPCMLHLQAAQKQYYQ